MTKDWDADMLALLNTLNPYGNKGSARMDLFHVPFTQMMQTLLKNLFNSMISLKYLDLLYPVKYSKNHAFYDCPLF